MAPHTRATPWRRRPVTSLRQRHHPSSPPRLRLAAAQDAAARRRTPLPVAARRCLSPHAKLPVRRQGTNGKPAGFLGACLQAVGPAYEARREAALPRHALRLLLLQGETVAAPASTPARQLLRRSGMRVELRFAESEAAPAPELESHLAPELELLRRLRTSLPELLEAPSLFLSHRADRAEKHPPFRAPELTAFATLATAHGPLAVRTLHLNCNGFGDAGAQILANLLASPQLPSLERLLLDTNEIGDAGLAALLAVLPSRPLLYFDLAHNLLGEGGVTALTAAVRDGALHVVELLDVTGNPGGSADTPVKADHRESARERERLNAQEVLDDAWKEAIPAAKAKWKAAAAAEAKRQAKS